MDSVTVVLAGIVLVALVSITVALIGKLRADDAAAYEKKMKATGEREKSIIAAAHVTVVGNVAFVFTGFNIKTNEVIWDKFPIDQMSDDESDQIVPQLDPRHALLVELCNLTIHHEKYGALSKRLMTADDAQAYCRANGGSFADRSKWDMASKYGQEQTPNLIYSHTGGKQDEQGLKINISATGGNTVAHLLSTLAVMNKVLYGAVTALPKA